MGEAAVRKVEVEIPEGIPVYAPSYALEEIQRHLHRLAERKGIPP